MTSFFDYGPPELSSKEKFDAFHAENPHIYEKFVYYTMQAIGVGRTRYSARTIIERIRWHTTVESNDPDFKINDHWPPFYVRLFEMDYPEHEGFFAKRRALADFSA